MPRRPNLTPHEMQAMLTAHEITLSPSRVAQLAVALSPVQATLRAASPEVQMQMIAHALKSLQGAE